MTPVDVRVETVIRRPRDAVAAYAAEPDNAPTWYVNIESAQWKSPRPLRVGSQFAFAATFLGRQLSYTYEVVEFVADQRLVMRTAEGPFPMETAYEWADAEPGFTRMALRNRGEPTGFVRFVAPMVAMAMRRANVKDLERLREILEA